jgi:perosamine synthetase
VINYSQPNVTEEQISAAVDVLRSGWIAGAGDATRRWEDMIAEFTGYRYAVAMMNATVALNVAVKAIGMRATRIKVPNFTYAATGLVVPQEKRYLTAPNDNMTTENGSFGISVSYAGYPLQKGGMIADDAHYVYPDMIDGATFPIRVLSHHAVKPVPCGEGGTLLTSDRHIYDYAIRYRTHGKPAHSVDGVRASLHEGSNYRMTDIQAAMLCARLQDWEKEQQRRDEVARYYYRNLLQNGTFVLPPTHDRHSWHLFVLRFKEPAMRNKVRKHLFDNGIGTQLHYPPLSEQPIFNRDKKEPGAVESSVSLFRRVLSIPMHSGLTDEEVIYITDTINEVIS